MTTVRQLLDQKGKNTRKGSTGRNANDHAAAGIPRSQAVQSCSCSSSLAADRLSMVEEPLRRREAL